MANLVPAPAISPLASMTQKLEDMAANPNRATALEELEQQAASMLLISERMGWTAFIALHLIRERELYKEAKDPDGQPLYDRFEDWLEEFRMKWKHSRSLAFRRLQTLRIATKGLGLSLERVAQHNPTTLHAICAAMPYDTKTGEIAAEVPPGKIGKAQALSLLEETEQLPPGEMMAQIREAQGKVRGRYYIDVDAVKGRIVRVSFIDTDGLKYDLFALPANLVQDFARKLRAEIVEI